MCQIDTEAVVCRNVLESLFNKVPGLKAFNFIKRDSNTGVFL